MKKVKILHFELSSQLGGIESFLLNLMRYIDIDFIQFDFITTSDEPANGELLKKLGANIYKVPSYKNITHYYKEINEIIRRNNYDVVHIHKNSFANIIPFVIAKKRNVPLVLSHSHNTAPSEGGIYKYLHYINRKYAIKNSSKLLACSELAGKWLYGDDKDVIILNNGIDVSSFKYSKEIRENMRNQFGFSDEPIFIHVGRFTAQKNHKFLMEIFKVIHEINNKSKLMLIGEGELQDDIKRIIEEYGLQESVYLLGKRSDINYLLQMADVFIMPSLYEGLPIAAIEAQASGVPIISSNTITKEVNITGLIKWCSLDDKAEVWAKCALQEVNKERKDMSIKISNAGFDMMRTAKRLKEIYLSTNDKI